MEGRELVILRLQDTTYTQQPLHTPENMKSAIWTNTLCKFYKYYFKSPEITSHHHFCISRKSLFCFRHLQAIVFDIGADIYQYTNTPPCRNSFSADFCSSWDLCVGVSGGNQSQSRCWFNLAQCVLPVICYAPKERLVWRCLCNFTKFIIKKPLLLFLQYNVLTHSGLLFTHLAAIHDICHDDRKHSDQCNIVLFCCNFWRRN